MAYRKILAPLTGGEGDAGVARQAVALAKAFASHVAGFYAEADPALTIASINADLPSRVIQELIDAAHAAAQSDLAGARAALELAAKSAGLPPQPSQSAGPSWSLHAREGFAPHIVADEALLSDLVLVQHPAESGSRPMREAVESVLLSTRSPLILVPTGAGAIVGQKVAIGWDGGLAASRAVAAAMPLLKRAQSVEILCVSPRAPATGEMDRLRDYLRIQGVAAAEHAVDPGSQDTGSVLVDAAKRAGAALLIVGGYGHSRLREIVLGGVTRHLLADVTMPLFMAH